MGIILKLFTQNWVSAAAHTKKKCSQLKQTIEKQADAINVKSSVVKFIYVVHKCWPGTSLRFATCVQVNISFARRRMRLQATNQTYYMMIEISEACMKGALWFILEVLRECGSADSVNWETRVWYQIPRTNKSVIGLLPARTRVICAWK